ncbi:MFS transporter [Azospirillum halopraeferens]|uniref:MFS transporter n=1 Tax=Azospirillum halopraeferens TaxID=34010 RepID=UPI00041E231A|nr:MFS transporter [Azospirillum halopraeferens]
MPSPFGSTLLTVLALLSGYAVLQVGNTLQTTLLVVRADIEGFSPIQIGLIGTAFSAGLVAGSLRAGVLIARVGHTRTFAALASLASAAALLHVLIVDPRAWVLFRALTGFCLAGLFIVVESWLNGTATSDMRGRLIGVYGMAGLGAGLVGQLLLPLADPAGFVLFCVASVLVSLALVPVALSLATAPGGDAPMASIDLPRLYRQSPFGVAAAFLCGISTGAFFGLAPLFARGIGLDQAGVALFMAATMLGGFVLMWPFGWLSDRMDRRTLVVGIAAAAAATQVFATLLTADRVTPWMVYGLVFLVGGLIVPTYSLVIAHVNDMVSPGEFVAASSGLLIVQGAGAALGPLAAGAAMASLGPKGLPYVIITAQVAMACWGVYRITRRTAPPVELKEGFVPMPAVPVGIELAPVPETAAE